jgi:hypothetical protein
MEASEGSPAWAQKDGVRGVMEGLPFPSGGLKRKLLDEPKPSKGVVLLFPLELSFVRDKISIGLPEGGLP